MFTVEQIAQMLHDADVSTSPSAQKGETLPAAFYGENPDGVGFCWYDSDCGTGGPSLCRTDIVDAHREQAEALVPLLNKAWEDYQAENNDE